MVKVNEHWVEFSFFRPQARQVHLTGDFNNWRNNELPMLRTSEGYWVAKVRLPVGEFRFRYCADGEWFTDFAAFGVTPGRFGLDSVVRVSPQPFRIAVAAQAAPPAAAA